MTQPSAPLSTDLPPISCLPGDALPWLPMSADLPGLAIKYLHINAAEDTLTALLRMPAGGTLPRHRHDGEVFVHTLQGAWRYLEYDWVARPGSYVQESPGAVHTLVSDDPNGMKTIFVLNGSLDFVDDNDQLIETLDVFWFIDHYTTYCKQNGIPINKKLFV